MQLSVKDDGQATLKVAFTDWIKLIGLLLVLAWGHATWQFGYINQVATDMTHVSQRLAVTEERVSTAVAQQAVLKSEVATSVRELRSSIDRLNEYLRDR